MIWPWLLSGAAAAGWFSIKYAWWRGTVDWRQPRVLMYHMISAPRRGARYNGMRVSPEMFERQLIWLRDNEFKFVTLSELAIAKPGGKLVALTFDDGYADNLLNALPLLKKYQARATLYLVAVRDDTDWSAKKKAHHDSGELVREPKLTDEQVRAMLDSGCIELGAHTLTHANLPKRDEQQRRAEIRDSKLRLEQLFGVKVSSFAYPFGIWEQKDRDLVAESGFTTAVTTDAGIDPLPFPDPLAIKRVKVSGKEGFRSFLLRIRTGQRGAWK